MSKMDRIDAIPKSCIGAFYHFRQRLQQRIDPNINAVTLWRTIIEEIESHVGDGPMMQFICRVDGRGRRLWRVGLGRRVFFVIFDHDASVPVTVISPQGYIRRTDNGDVVNLLDYV